MRLTFRIIVALVAASNPMPSALAVQDRVDASTWLFFSGFDLWHNHGGFLHGGLVWSPDGLDRTGFALKLLVGSGRYGYVTGATDVVGNHSLASVMPGWRIKAGKSELTLFAGLDLQDHRLAPDDPLNHMQGTHLGLRIGGEYWSEPSADWMLNAAATLSTIGTSYWTRAALGWRLHEAFWIGPEIQALGNSTYRQFRLGAHVTGFKTGALEWSAAIGFMSDSDDRAGSYGRLGVLTRR